MSLAETLKEWRARLVSQPTGDAKFGTFAGVFVPTILTILGAIMYLREGWVVGNAGLGGAIAIILLAHVITICTGLAVSSIATNVRVGVGGAFSIISQSLGLEIGGSIGVPLFLAQGISTALYVFAFTEGVLRIFPGLPEWLVVYVTFGLVLLIAYTSARLAARVQVLILVVVGLSLVSVFLGSFAIGGRAGMVYAPQFWGGFREGDFWETFAIFFPAVTGIMAGISLSGNLRDPQESIPRGTLSAIGLALGVYLLLAFWLARVATPAELVTNLTIMVDRASAAWLVLAGLLGATFSSALGSMVAAPRVMHALGIHRVVPWSRWISGQTDQGDPREATLVTGLIVLVAVSVALVGGGLDFIAPLITMFFLLTYGILNAVVLLEQTLGMVSFRPTFSVPRSVPLIGLVGCIFVMVLINATFSIVAIAVALLLYAYLVRRHLETPWEDVRSGLFLSLAEWAAEKSSRMPAAPERTWKPNILAPITTPAELVGSYRFLRAIAMPQGSVFALGIYPPGQGDRFAALGDLAGSFASDGVYSRTTLLEAEDFSNGIKAAMEVLSSAFFRPNILFLTWNESRPTSILTELLSRATAYQIGTALFWRHPVLDLGRERTISVFVREQGPDWELGLRLSNLDLSVLLAYQIARNWRGNIRLCMVVEDSATCHEGEAFLLRLVRLARLPASTEVHVRDGAFWEKLAAMPQADLSVFGLPREPDLDFVARILATATGSCVFVRDSGNESALA